MGDEAYEPFLKNILGILEKNGYPEKRVSLPLERMYEVAYEKGLNFNKTLTQLEAKGVAHEKTKDKIVFFPASAAGSEAGAMPDFATMMAKAQEMMKNMTPEQLQQIEKMISNMSPEERDALMQQAQSQFGMPPPPSQGD